MAVFVVIFRARVRQFDEEYSRVAARMRDLAMRRFGCLEFHAVTEGEHEVALSYWPDEESIRAWRNHPEHVGGGNHPRVPRATPLMLRPQNATSQT